MSPKIGVVTTYQPTNCGIATFSASLMKAIDSVNSHSTRVVRLVERNADQDDCAPEIVATIAAGDHDSISRAAATLNKMDVVLIQHEFGIYGGEDGEDVVTLISQLSVPSIVVLHTVLSAPSAHQKSIIIELCTRASATVVMSKVAVDRLLAEDSIDASKIFLIQHGARRVVAHEVQRKPERPVILTWGLISPGKGIEWVIKSLNFLRDISPAPLYVIAGRTHPKVLEREGESYRQRLQGLVAELHLENLVHFQPAFLANEALDSLIASASLVVLPYDNSEQVTSGVLIEAVSAGRPIIATRFPHAVELLDNEVGILVPRQDPSAIANAIRRVLVVPEVAQEMSYRTKLISAGIQWPVIAHKYLQLASSLIYARVVA